MHIELSTKFSRQEETQVRTIDINKRGSLRSDGTPIQRLKRFHFGTGLRSRWQYPILSSVLLSVMRK